MWGREQLRKMVHDFSRPFDSNSVNAYARYSRDDDLPDADRQKLRTLFLEVLWDEYPSVKDVIDRAPIDVQYEALAAIADYPLVNTRIAEKNSNLLNALKNLAEDGEGDVNLNETISKLMVDPKKNLKLKDANKDKVLASADHLKKKYEDSRAKPKQPDTESTTNNAQTSSINEPAQQDQQEIDPPESEESKNTNGQQEKLTKRQRSALRRQQDAQQRQAEKALNQARKKEEENIEKEIPKIEISATNHNGTTNANNSNNIASALVSSSSSSSSKFLKTLAINSNLKFPDAIMRLLDIIEDAFNSGGVNHFVAFQSALRDQSIVEVYALFKALVEISVENKAQLPRLAPYLTGVVVCHTIKRGLSVPNPALLNLTLALTSDDLKSNNKWPDIFVRFYNDPSLASLVNIKDESERYVHISYAVWFITAASLGTLLPTLNMTDNIFILLHSHAILDFINQFDDYILEVQTRESQELMSDKNVLIQVLKGKSLEYIQSNGNREALHKELKTALPDLSQAHKVSYGARKYFKAQQGDQAMSLDEIGCRISVLVDFEYTISGQLDPVIKILLPKMTFNRVLFDDSPRIDLFENTLCPAFAELMPYQNGLTGRAIFMHPDNLADLQLLLTCAIAFINQYAALTAFKLIQVPEDGEIAKMLKHRFSLFTTINAFQKYCEEGPKQESTEQTSNLNLASKTNGMIQDPEYYKVLNLMKIFEQDRPLWANKETIKNKWLLSQLQQFENDYPSAAARKDMHEHFKKMLNSGIYKYPEGARACAEKFWEMMVSSASKASASSAASSSNTSSTVNHLRDAKKGKAAVTNNNNNNNNNSNNNNNNKQHRH